MEIIYCYVDNFGDSLIYLYAKGSVMPPHLDEAT